jgi:tetratricopeptide (TPR) repeat protein
MPTQKSRSLFRIAGTFIALLLVSSASAHPLPSYLRTIDPKIIPAVTKAAVLTRLAGAWNSSGKPEHASQLLSQAEQLIAPIEEVRVKSWVLNKIGNERAALGQFEQAEEIAAAMADPVNAADVLSKIAEKKAKHTPDAALNLLSQARVKADSVKDNEERTGNYIRLSGSYAKLGDINTARDLLRQAESTADTVAESSARLSLWNEIGGSWFKAEDKRRAEAVFATNFRAILKLTAPDSQANLLFQMAGEHAENGQRQRATEFLKQAENFVQNVTDPESRDQIRAEIAWNYSQSAAFEHAVKVTDSIEEPHAHAVAKARVAGNWGRAGSRKEASALLDKALAVSREIEDPAEKAEAIIIIVGSINKAKLETPVLPLLEEAESILK